MKEFLVGDKVRYMSFDGEVTERGFVKGSGKFVKVKFNGFFKTFWGADVKRLTKK